MEVSLRVKKSQVAGSMLQVSTVRHFAVDWHIQTCNFETCNLRRSQMTVRFCPSWKSFLGLSVGILFKSYTAMEKIKNGDPVIYKEQVGTIYGKPRESKYRGTMYTVKVGDEYFKAAPSELKVANEELGKPLTRF